MYKILGKSFPERGDKSAKVLRHNEFSRPSKEVRMPRNGEGASSDLFTKCGLDFGMGVSWHYSLGT